ncbi:metal ABC transporter permease [Marinigracilibium pacificum]|uniref:Iron chelate uptake ABC transporter family permease subunit n=1 Tax=Marinigracilibium pacificum TaxID=2729599 RepID=A0A848JAG3_9BACT|nr:iron chelate uptake ABC transporter family permease subunit [Marinigracilibium pacificum]NMM50032.1 iron chelate uptake ABC transporter family permease subunit [Marinigracilibium pacificum]
MKEIIYILSDPNVQYVLLGCILLSFSAGLAGTFAYLQRKALIGDAISHSVLPGVAIAFMLIQVKSLPVLLTGAFISGLISQYLVVKLSEHPKVSKDTAIGFVLTFFFGIGIVCLTFIQQSGYSGQSGLEDFIFGKAATLVKKDIYLFIFLSITIIIAVLLFKKEFTLVSFDMDFARTSGLKVNLINNILTGLYVMAIVSGIQSVGVILMSALVITPAAAARFWTNNINKLLIISSLTAGVSGGIGVLISYSAPQMPTGPWVVVTLSLIALFSFLIAPETGIISKWMNQRKNRNKIHRENILKLLYKICEEKGSLQCPIPLDLAHSRYSLSRSEFNNKLKELKSSDYLEYLISGDIKLTNNGMNEGQRIVRLHRLWEAYLATYLRIAPDHVHDDAEAIEHVITPELEAKLEKELGYPESDPHKTIIPRKAKK